MPTVSPRLIHQHPVPDLHCVPVCVWQFNINRQTGVIRLVGPPSPLAQHSEEDYSFTVVARDTHNLNDTATVHVHVIGQSAGDL